MTEDRGMCERGTRRHGLVQRATALGLSWIFTATTVWAAAPPPVRAAVAKSKTDVVGASMAPIPAEVAVSPQAEAPSALQEASVGAASSRGMSRTAVRPLLECVAANDDRTHTAFFGYENERGQPVTIPAGPRNRVTPGGVDQGQPTSFLPGRSPAYPNVAFRLPFDGSRVAWTLRGPDAAAGLLICTEAGGRAPISRGNPSGFPTRSP